MTVTEMDLDDDVLQEAMRLMGAGTKTETVNAALREYVQQSRRLEAFDKLLEMGRRGDFDQAEDAHARARWAWKQAFSADGE